MSRTSSFLKLAEFSPCQSFKNLTFIFWWLSFLPVQQTPVLRPLQSPPRRARAWIQRLRAPLPSRPLPDRPIWQIHHLSVFARVHSEIEPCRPFRMRAH